MDGSDYGGGISKTAIVIDNVRTMKRELSQIAGIRHHQSRFRRRGKTSTRVQFIVSIDVWVLSGV